MNDYAIPRRQFGPPAPRHGTRSRTDVSTLTDATARMTASVMTLTLLLGTMTASAQGFIQKTVRALADSDINFQRSDSNAPFFPIAFLRANTYGDAQVRNEATGRSLTYTQNSAAAAGGVPFLVSRRDALFAGAYLATNDFNAESDQLGDFRVDTVGLPVGWFRQVNPEWQVAAFAMPLLHRSTQESSLSSLQTMGGLFTRYTRNERLWWAFGVFADDSPSGRYVLPYVGASWVINPRWTVSAIMPWPNIRYSPNPDWSFALGASPSGAGWSLQPLQNEVAVSLDAWDFGLTAERRLFGNVWVAASSGVGGLRGVRVNADDATIEGADISVGASAFFSLSLKLRPAMR